MPLRRQARRAAEEVRRLADRAEAEHQHDDAREAHAEAAVRGRAVAEEVEVLLELRGVHALLDDLRLEHLDAVLALRAGRDLDAVVDEVVGVRDVGPALGAQVVERPHARRELRDEDEVVAHRLLDVRRDLALRLRVEVAVLALDRVAAGLDDGLDLGVRDAREGQRRRLEHDAEVLLDLGAVALDDRGDRLGQQRLVQLHDLLVRVDPGDLAVDRGELGRVAARVGGVGAERRADLEDLAEAGRLRHLLEELRRLREVGGGLEVGHLEELGARLGGRRHELGGVELDEALVDPVLAHRVLDGRLHAEDQLRLGAAQVEEAPVEALVDRRVLGDRAVLRDRLDGERPHLDLEAAELDALVRLEVALDGDERAVHEARDRRGGLRGVVVDRVHELGGARLVAQDHELHALLIAHRLDPALHLHGAVGERCEVMDQGARGHGPILPARCGAPGGRRVSGGGARPRRGRRSRARPSRPRARRRMRRARPIRPSRSPAHPARRRRRAARRRWPRARRRRARRASRTRGGRGSAPTST